MIHSFLSMAPVLCVRSILISVLTSFLFYFILCIAQGPNSGFSSHNSASWLFSLNFHGSLLHSLTISVPAFSQENTIDLICLFYAKLYHVLLASQSASRLWARWPPLFQSADMAQNTIALWAVGKSGASSFGKGLERQVLWLTLLAQKSSLEALQQYWICISQSRKVPRVVAHEGPPMIYIQIRLWGE